MGNKPKATAADKAVTETASGKPVPLTTEERLSKLEKQFLHHQHGKDGTVEVHEPKAEAEQEPAEEQKTEGEETK